MTKRARLLAGGAALIAVTLFVSTQVRSQEKPAAQPPGEGQMAEMMAKWNELNAKGPEHERFKDAVGTWETEMKMWMAPGTEPLVSKGTAQFRLILDGRYLEQKYKSDQGGEPFEGLAIEGYDRMRKKYVSIWIDSMSTGIFMSEGTADASGKVYTYYGKMDDPFTGERDKVVRSVARVINDDKLVFEMYDRQPAFGEFKSMEITYIREK